MGRETPIGLWESRVTLSSLLFYTFTNTELKKTGDETSNTAAAAPQQYTTLRWYEEKQR